MKASRQDIEACTNAEFLGYGEPTAGIWLVGLEEHGAEVRSGAITLGQSLRARSSFGIAEDLGTTWEGAFNFPVANLKTGTWWWASRLMLALAGETDPTKTDIRAYRASHLGTAGGESFLPDLYPLPMNKRDYSAWYAEAPWPSYRKYTRAVAPIRAERILSLAAKQSGSLVIVAYSRVVGDALRAAWSGVVTSLPGMDPSDSAAWWTLAGDGPDVRMAVTPFWGQGRYSKVELLALADNIREFRNDPAG